MSLTLTCTGDSIAVLNIMNFVIVFLTYTEEHWGTQRLLCWWPTWAVSQTHDTWL